MDNQTQETRPAINTAQGEMNLIQYGLGTLGGSRSFEAIELHNGQGGKLIIAPNTTTGLPTFFEQKMFVAWTCDTVEKGNPDKLYLNPYRDASTLNLYPDGRFYERWQRALETWNGITIYSQQMWFDQTAKKKKTINSGFHLIDYYVTIKDTDDDKVNDRNQLSGDKVYGFLKWGEPYRKSIDAGYLVTFDKDLFFSLSAAPALAYLRSSVHLWKNGDKTFDLLDFCRDIRFALNRPERKLKSEFTRRVADPLIDNGAWSKVEFFKPNGYWKFRVKAGGRTVVKPGANLPPKTKAEKPETKEPEVPAVEPIVIAEEIHPAEEKWGTTDEHRQLDQKLKRELEISMTGLTFNGHFRSSRVLFVEDNKSVKNVTFGVNNKFSLDWIQKRHLKQIKEKLASIFDISLASISLRLVNLQDYEQSTDNSDKTSQRRNDEA